MYFGLPFLLFCYLFIWLLKDVESSLRVGLIAPAPRAGRVEVSDGRFE